MAGYLQGVDWNKTIRNIQKQRQEQKQTKLNKMAQ